jgi:hypothetical protein
MKQIKDLQAGTSGDTIPLTAGGTGATSASAARTALGATTTGNSLFTSASAAAARTTLGATTTGNDLFTSADAAAGRTALGATTVGSNVFTAADAAAARTAIGAGTGTGDVTLAGAQTFTGTKTFSGTSSALAMVLNDVAEVITTSATAATGTINYDITTNSLIYYTSNASANWTVNLRASSGTSLNTALETGQAITVAFLVTQGGTAYYNNSVQVDGTTSGVTTRWQGGAPTKGNASGIDVYTYTIIKTASATFTVIASQTQFKA